MSYLNDLVKVTGNEYASIVEDGVGTGDVTHHIDTGSYALNALVSGSLYGGFAGNKITAIAGEQATGMTSSFWVWSGTFLNLTQLLGYYTLNLSQRLANS